MPWFGGDLIEATQRMPEEVPDTWQAAARELGRRDDGTRVLVLPGTDFAAYRWGFALEPVLPGLTDGPPCNGRTSPTARPARSTSCWPSTGASRRVCSIRPPSRPLPGGSRRATSSCSTTWPYLSVTPRRGQEELWGFENVLPGVSLSPCHSAARRRTNPSGPCLDAEEYRDLGLDDPPELAIYDVDAPLPIVRAARGVPGVLAWATVRGWSTRPPSGSSTGRGWCSTRRRSAPRSCSKPSPTAPTSW